MAPLVKLVTSGDPEERAKFDAEGGAEQSREGPVTGALTGALLESLPVGGERPPARPWLLPSARRETS